MKKDFIKVGVTGKLGLYSEMQIGEETSSDIAFFIETLGDINAFHHMVQNFKRVTIRLFFDAKAEIELDLSELFPVPKGANLKFTLAVSSLLEINLGSTVPDLPSPSDSSISVWYKSLDKNGFRSNTHEAASKLCISKGEKP